MSVRCTHIHTDIRTHARFCIHAEAGRQAGTQYTHIQICTQTVTHTHTQTHTRTTCHFILLVCAAVTGASQQDRAWEEDTGCCFTSEKGCLMCVGAVQ